MATIIVFCSSLFLAIALLVFKAIDIKYGSKNFILGLLSRLEGHFGKAVSVVKFKILQVVQSVRYIILVQIKEMSRHLFNKTHEKILNEYKMRQSIIMGQKEIAGNGSVSFYLKKITEHKGGSVRGKIEDSL